MGKLYKISLYSSIALLSVLLFTYMDSALVQAVSPVIEGARAAQGTDQPGDLFGGTGVFNTISNILLFIVGAISVIMLVIGGLRYAVSGGNSTAVTAAKNTILYAIVGLVVAFLAYAAINFILSSLTGGGAGGGTDV